MDDGSLTNWKNASNRPAPYLTDEGFPNPACSEDGVRRVPHADAYVIGEDQSCMAQENDSAICNGPLKPKTHYVYVTCCIPFPLHSIPIAFCSILYAFYAIPFADTLEKIEQC